MTAPAAAPASAAGGIIAGAKSLVQRLFETRGGAYPAPGRDSTPAAKHDYVNSLLMDGENDALLRYKLAVQAFLFSDGRQHLDWTAREKGWREQAQPSGRIHVTMNYVRPILRSRLQRMMSAELLWRAIPHSNDYEERDRCTTAENFLQGRWEKTHMDAKVRQALWFAFHSGHSALKTFWNASIGPLTPATQMLPHPKRLEAPTNQDGSPNPKAGLPLILEYPLNRQGQPLADENGDPAPPDDEQVYRYRPGDTDTALRSVFNLRLNPDAWGYEPDEGCRWILDSEVVPVSVVKERYGERARKVSSLAGSTAGRNYERIVRSLNGTLGVTSPGGDLASGRSNAVPDKDGTLLTEYWEHPTPLMPEGRLIVIAGGELIYPQDGDPEGLPQGIVPFDPIYDERRPYDWSGRASAHDLIPPQKVINRQWEGELEEQMRHGTGQWMFWGVPGLSNQITNLSGSHIEIPTTSALAHRPIGDVIQRVPPPGFNASRWRLIEEAKATMFDIGAYHEIQRGQVPPGVDSGVAVQYLQEAENAQLHDPVANLKASTIAWGRKQIKYARWGYGANEVRWVPVHRPDLGFLAEGVKGADLPDPDDIDLTLDGFRPTSQAALRAEVKDLMDKQQIPVRDGLALMDLGRGVQGIFESQTRHYARARRENLAIQRGEVIQGPVPEGSATEGLDFALVHPDKTPFLLPADDDHQVHITIHQDIALDDTQPWELRKMALLHILEHRTMLSQQQKQAPPEPKTTIAIKGATLDPEQTREALAAEGVNVPPLNPASAQLAAAAHEPPQKPGASDGPPSKEKPSAGA